jgi:predicted ATPase
MEPLATLLERERELAELRSALSDARQGRGRLVLAEGTAGLGKTSLLRTAADIAAGSGVACLRARANELERDFAYGCVRQLLEPAVAKASESARVTGSQRANTPAALAVPDRPASVVDGPFIEPKEWPLASIVPRD